MPKAITKLLHKPRKSTTKDNDWTKDEELLLKRLLEKALGPQTIKEHFPGRSLTSLKSKIQKFKIKYETYGSDDKNIKRILAEKWLTKIKPKSVFEGFAGLGNLTKIYIKSGAKKIYACEMNEQRYFTLLNNISKFMKSKGINSNINGIKIRKFSINNQEVYLAHCNSERLAAYLYSKGEYFDLVDLDPCGTTLPSMALFLKLIKNGYLEATYGEFHSYRLGRIDVMLKSVPTIVNYSKDGISMKEVGSVKELYNKLVSWTCLQGAATLDYGEQKFVNPIDHSNLGNRQVFRVLYKVDKADSLTKIVNKSIAIMKSN